MPILALAAAALTGNVAGAPTDGQYTMTAVDPSALAIHVGDTTTIDTTIKNTGTGTQDTLDYTALTAAVTGGTGTGSLTLATGSGTALAQGATSTAVLQTLTGTGGGTVIMSPSATVTNSTAVGTPTVSPANTSATVSVYALADPNTITTPVTLTNVRVGGTFVNQAVSIQNMLQSGQSVGTNFQEDLGASSGATTGSATITGSNNQIEAGTTDNSSVVVGLGGSANTGTAGQVTGTATVVLTSTGNVKGTSDTLGSTPLPSQTLTVTGGVYNMASVNTLPTTPIAFGKFHVGSAPAGQTVTVTNTAPTGAYTEKLDATTTTTGGATVSGSPISLLAAGSSSDLTVGVTDAAGVQNGTIVVSSKSDGTGTSGLASTAVTSNAVQTISVTGTGIYEATPNTITTPVNITNVHVGGTFANKAVSISNVLQGGLLVGTPYQEDLSASSGATTGAATITGSNTQIEAGQTDNTSVVVGLGGNTNTGTAGQVTGTATVDLTSTGAVQGTSDGLGSTVLTPQTLTVTGGVYNLAAVNTLPTAIDFGNFHVGAAPVPQTVTVTNTAPTGAYTEKLDVSTTITPAIPPDFVGNGPTVGGSPITLLAAGSSANLALGVTDTAGAQNGTVHVASVSDGTGTSGLASTSLGTQDIVLTGTGIYEAKATTLATPVTLTNVHVGGSFVNQALSIQNVLQGGLLVGTPYQEDLSGSSGATTGNATIAGSFANLAAGAPANTSITVGLGGSTNTGTAGQVTGTATVNLTSTGAVQGTSDGLGSTALTPQTLTVTGAVFALANPNTIQPPTPPASTTPQPTPGQATVTSPYTVYYVGYAHQNGPAEVMPLSITNVLQPGQSINSHYQEDLNVSASASGSATASGTIAHLAAGNNDDTSINVGLDTTTAGTVSGNVALTLTSTGTTQNGTYNDLLGTTALSTQNFTLAGTVYTGQGTWNLNGSGNWGTISQGTFPGTTAGIPDADFLNNWNALGGAPGVSGAPFLNTDTATFDNTVLTNGSSATVTLNGANPSLAEITFNTSDNMVNTGTNLGGYTIAQGSGGTLTLDGTNTFNPDGNALVTVTSGTHTISAPVILATSADFNVGSEAGIQQQLTISGQISGAGGVNSIGSGSLTLVGQDIYTGATTVSDGTLTIGNGTTGSIDSTSSVTTSGTGKLAFDEANNSTFALPITNGGTVVGAEGTGITNTLSGVISDGSAPGAFLQSGLGTTILSNVNNYSGGTTITGGTLQTGVTGALGATTGSLNISGMAPASVGTLDLAGNSQTVGATTLISNSMITSISAATLATSGVTVTGINNTIGSNVTLTGGQVSVMTAAALANSGTISTNVNLAGGPSIPSAALTNNGNITGTIYLGSTPAQNVINSGFTSVPTSMLTTGSGVNVPLNNLNLPFVGGSGTGVISGANLVLDKTASTSLGINQTLLITQNNTLTNDNIQFDQRSVLSGLVLKPEIINGNTYLVATPNSSLLTFSGANGPYLQSLFGAINNHNQQAINAFNKVGLLVESEHAGLPASIGSFESSIIAPHVSDVELRLTDAREGKSGFSASNVGEGLAGPSGDDGKSGPDFLAPSSENRWGVFLTGIGDFAKTGSLNGYVGYNTTQSGFTLGADYRLTPNLVLGVLAGFAHEHAGFADGSALSVDGAKFGFYGTAFSGGFYGNFAAIGGYDSFDSHRVDLLGAVARGTGDAEEVAGFLGGGYDFTFGNFKIGPTASFQYQRSFTDGFTETGGTLPLEFPSQSTGDITTKAGAKMSMSFKALGFQITPELRTEWQHDFRGVIPVDFAVPQGPTVQDYSPHVGLDSLSVVAGFSAQISETITLYLYYNTDLLRDNYTENDVSGGIRFAF